MCFSEILQPDIYPSNSSEYEEGKMDERWKPDETTRREVASQMKRHPNKGIIGGIRGIRRNQKVE